MKKRNIAVVFGGYSSENVVSRHSAQGIASFLDAERYAIYLVDIERDRWTVELDGESPIDIDRSDFSFVYGGEKILFDLAYITIHGDPGENGILQGYFDMLGIPYSCCGVFAAALTFNKFVCNRFLSQLGCSKIRRNIIILCNILSQPSLSFTKLRRLLLNPLY